MGRSLAEAVEMALAKRYRNRISRRVHAGAGGVVRHGPFAGMRLENGSHISDGPLALKVLGLYEQDLMDEVTARRWDALVNLGGGDGFYPVGMVRGGLAGRAVVFEMRAEGRETIQRNARANGVADAIVLHGAAGPDWHERVLADGVSPEDALVLCDIEGAEFELLDAASVGALAGATFMVELHHPLVADGARKLEALHASFAPTHGVRTIKATPPRWGGMEEVERMRDLERALVTCEGRKMLGEWLIAVPR